MLCSKGVSGIKSRLGREAHMSNIREGRLRLSRLLRVKWVDKGRLEAEPLPLKRSIQLPSRIGG